MGLVGDSLIGPVLFHSKPLFSGNARALYEHFLEARPDLDLRWLVPDQASRTKLAERGVPAVVQRSVAGIGLQARASTLITTHGVGAARHMPWVRVVSLWHGTSPKGVGFTRRSASGRDRKKKRRFGARVGLATASSTNMANVLAAAHGIDPGRIAVTGHPRNDWLFRSVDAALRNAIVPGAPPDARVVLYVPTTRGELGASNGGGPFQDLWESEPIRSVLARANAVLLVKPHPYDEEQSVAANGRAEMGRIRALTTDLLDAHGLDLYEALPSVDVLVTDLSSIYFDFLLLDRPIVFFTPDLQAFSATRGFKVEPLDLWMPGERCGDPPALAEALSRALDEEDSHRDARSVVRRLVHRYEDDRSCQRVRAAIERRWELRPTVAQNT